MTVVKRIQKLGHAFANTPWKYLWNSLPINIKLSLNTNDFKANTKNWKNFDWNCRICLWFAFIFHFIYLLYFVLFFCYISFYLFVIFHVIYFLYFILFICYISFYLFVMFHFIYLLYFILFICYVSFYLFVIFHFIYFLYFILFI